MLVGDPAKRPAEVNYYQNGRLADWSALKWTDGPNDQGKAAVLTGDGDYIGVGGDQLKIGRMTLTGWINWQGTASNNDDDMYNQRLFTLSNGEEAYITLIPFIHDPETTDQKGELNGLRLTCKFFGESANTFDLFEGLEPSPVSNNLPLHQWHHFAVKADTMALRLYIDGVMWFEKKFLKNISDFNADSLMIGSGLWDEPTLNAWLADVYLYDSALSDSQIKILASGEDPKNDGTQAEKTTYLPTKPPPTTTAPPETLPTATETEQIDENTGTFYGVPLFGLQIIAGVIAGFFLLSIGMSVIYLRKRHNAAEKQIHSEEDRG
ncbi:MAG: LamG domain-containing protein [Oscillospiraceae bacterium]|nr:LamG domain-containing protein [Oscillospiraceae bacterium]